MLFSSAVAYPRLLLQLCISTMHSILTSFFSTLRHWTAGARKVAASPVSPADCKPDRSTVQDTVTPTSVNYHFTRKCNYKCGFCFHTAKTSFVLPLEEAKRGLKLLKESGKLYRELCSCLVQSIQNIYSSESMNTTLLLHYKYWIFSNKIKHSIRSHHICRYMVFSILYRGIRVNETVRGM